MQRVFLDVGAHHGQTIKLLLQPKFRIDHIVGFDPSPICHQILEQKFGNHRKVTIVKAGLWSHQCEMDLHNEGSQGGTVYADYQTTCNPEPRITKCQFLKASDWFRENVNNQDEVFLKLNCEGSECDIINDLLDTKEYDKIKAIFVDFDVRKSPSQKYKEEALLKRMKKMNIKNLHLYMGNHRHLVLSSVLCKKRS